MTFVFAHGAGAGSKHPWMKRVAAGLAERGIRVVTFDFPYMAEGRKVPDKAPVLEEAFKSTWDAVAATAAGPIFAGGKSMGGRIASQAAARGLFAPKPAGLVFFGYPLHPPGQPLKRRDKHLPAIDVPMLFLHGSKDPFGTPEEMRELVGRLEPAPAHAGATLELFDGADHSLARRSKTDDTVGRAIAIAAEWMLRQPSATE